MEHIGQFFKQRRVGYTARVHFRIEKTEAASTVTLHLAPPPEQRRFSQGMIESAYSPGYDDWIRGAVLGVEFALSQINNAAYAVTITEILGLTSDTNPTIVAAAAALGVWEAADFDPGSSLLEFVQHKALTSWDLPGDALPSFETV